MTVEHAATVTMQIADAYVTGQRNYVDQFVEQKRATLEIQMGKGQSPFLRAAFFLNLTTEATVIND